MRAGLVSPSRSGDAFYTGERERLVDYRGELAPFGDSPDAAFQLYRQ